MTATRQARTTGAGLIAFLFCALLLRTFVPGGYMIGAAASGGPALVLCPDTGAIPVAHHGHHQHPPAHHREAPCPFGALAAPALPPTPVLLPAQTELVAPRVEPQGLAALAAPPLAAPPPPATGPPVSV